MLKARLSTLAIKGMTPEEAEVFAETQGETSGTSGSGDIGR